MTDMLPENGLGGRALLSRLGLAKHITVDDTISVLVTCSESTSLILSCLGSATCNIRSPEGATQVMASSSSPIIVSGDSEGVLNSMDSQLSSCEEGCLGNDFLDLPRL